MHNLLFCTHAICMNYVTKTFLLVSSSVRSEQLLCFVQGQDLKREQKHTANNFVGFHNHSPLLTLPVLTGQLLSSQGLPLYTVYRFDCTMYQNK